MSQFEGKFDDFGMDTISLAGPLKAKLSAMKAAGFTQVMLLARDLVGHPDGWQAAVQEVVELGARDDLPVGREHRRRTARWALPFIRRVGDHPAQRGPVTLGEGPSLVKQQLLRRDHQEHRVGRVPVERVEPAVQLVKLPFQVARQGVAPVRRTAETLHGVAHDVVAPGVERG